MFADDVSTSKSARIYLWLRAEFEAGRIAVDDRLPSENELCDRFGAARPAVRQAVVRLVHEGLAETLRGKGSFRREIRNDASRDVALVLPSIGSYIYPELAEAANSALRGVGYQTLFDCTGGDRAVERKVLEGLCGRKPAGLIISPAQGRLFADAADAADAADLSAEVRGNLDLLKDLRAAGMAVILLDNELGGESFSSIVMDDRAGGAKAVDALAAMGHREIAVAWRPGHAPFEARKLGALERLAGIGLPAGPLDELRIEAPGTEGAGAALDAASAAGKAPTAIFCVNDQLAVEMMEALAARGLRVPQDVSLIGFDDSPAARLPGISLTTFDYPSRWIGARAAGLMIESLTGARLGTCAKSRVNVTVDPELIERGSAVKPVERMR